MPQPKGRAYRQSLSIAVKLPPKQAVSLFSAENSDFVRMQGKNRPHTHDPRAAQTARRCGVSKPHHLQRLFGGVLLGFLFAAADAVADDVAV